MDVVSLVEVPSESRRRLSVTFEGLSKGGHNVETLERVCARRQSVCLPTPGDEKLSTDDEHASNRISIVGRRASALTRYFALPSTSEEFVKNGLRPTLVNAMLYFTDPNPSVEKLRQVFAERLLDLPRFRSNFRFDKETGQVHWDPISRSSIDLEYHVQVIDGKREFDEDSVQKLISDSYLKDWDVSKPLWKMHLVTNLKDGRSLLFCVIDHAIGDGIALLTVMLSLLDDPPLDDQGKQKVKSFQKKRRATSTQGLRWSHRVVNFIGGAMDGITQAFEPPIDPPNIFKIKTAPAGGKQHYPGKTFAQTRAFDLIEMKAMKNKLSGTTVNDIVMAIQAMAIRQYFEETNDPALESLMEGKSKLHAEFPVNVRPHSQDILAVLGNQITMGLFPFPFTFKDPIDAVFLCKSKVDALKSSPIFFVKKVMVDLLLSIVPADLLLKKMEDEGGPRSTLMISNVMGPGDETCLAGYTLDDLNFTASYHGGVYCGVLSYNSKVRLSIIIDKLADANAKKLVLCLEKAYDDLKDAVFQSAPNKEDIIQTPTPATPLSAKIIELVFGMALLTIPVIVAYNRNTRP